VTRATPIPDTLTLHVPFCIVKRGGRKEMQLPESAAQARKPDNTLVKALARAFRWKRLIDSGEFATIADLAEREGIAAPYLTRVLRLTLLAPDIVEAILDGRQRACLTLETLREPAPAEWQEQLSWLYRNHEVSVPRSYPLPAATAYGYNPKHDESK
jgi:hypothetical protein